VKDVGEAIGDGGALGDARHVVDQVLGQRLVAAAAAAAAARLEVVGLGAPVLNELVAPHAAVHPERASRRLLAGDLAVVEQERPLQPAAHGVLWYPFQVCARRRAVL